MGSYVIMVEKPAENIQFSSREAAKAELTPEQVVGITAGQDILRYREALLDAGITEEQIIQATKNASDMAREKYQQLEETGPWHWTMETIERLKKVLSPDDQKLLSAHVQWAHNLAFKWGEALNDARSIYGVDTPIQILIRNVWQFSLLPNSSILRRDGRQYLLGFKLIEPKVRFLIYPSVEADAKGAHDVLMPSKEGIVKIFQTFGANVPERRDDKTLERDGAMVPTRLHGVYLHLSSRGDSVAIYFDPQTLEKVIETRGST